MCRNISPPRGAALFLVLWALLVVSVALVVAVRIVDLDLEGESASQRRFEARMLALSGLAVASHPQVEPRSELLRRDFGDGRSWSAQIASENSRLNINRILRREESETLRRLFAHWGLNERQFSTLYDSLADWTDADELRRVNGAEAADIPLDSGWSKPENRPFLDVAEMERVRGMEWVEEVKPDWREYFSVDAGRKLDLQFARQDLIEALAGIDSGRAAKFVQIRDGEDGLPGTEDDAVFESIEDALVALGVGARERQTIEEHFTAGGAGLRRIVSRGEAAGTAYTIEAVLAPAQGGPAQILSWREY